MRFEGFGLKDTTKAGRLYKPILGLLALFMFGAGVINSIRSSDHSVTTVGLIVSLFLIAVFLVFRYLVARLPRFKEKIVRSRLGRFIWRLSYIFLFIIGLLLLVGW